MKVWEYAYTRKNDKLVIAIDNSRHQPSGQRCSYFSNSLSAEVSKLSSQPTSIRTLTPPSSSKIDCEALEWEYCAPSSGVKVNILAEIKEGRSLPDRVAQRQKMEVRISVHESSEIVVRKN